MFKYYRIAKFSEELASSVDEVFYKESYEDALNPNRRLQVYDFATKTYLLDDDIKPIIERFLYNLVIQRYYASIIGVNINAASNSLMVAIINSADNYGRRILAIETNLTNLIVNKSKIHKSTNTDISTETIEDESEDNISDSGLNQIEETPQTKSLLVKENDTPNAGNNTDLLSDTYLSRSQRNVEEIGTKVVNNELENVRSIVTGQRKSTINNLGLAENNYEIILEDADAESLTQLLSLISNTYEDWLEYIESKHLVYTEDFQQS